MFDTMTMTKIVGGLCGTFLVFLMINWGAESIYGTGAETPHEGGEHQAKMGYMIAVAEPKSSEKEPAKQVDFATLLQNASADAGKKIFKKCASCHKIDGQNAVGPHLNGVVGRKVASVSDYSYDSALESLGGVWTPDRLEQFLTSPKAYAPGTKMGFAGLPKAQDRADVIKYLETTSG